jgi:hypothetical protein
MARMTVNEPSDAIQTDPLPVNPAVRDATERVSVESPIRIVERVWVRDPYRPKRKWYQIPLRRIRSVAYAGVEPLGYVGLTVLALFLMVAPIVLVNLSIADLEMRAPAEGIEQPEKKADALQLEIRFLEHHLRE